MLHVIDASSRTAVRRQYVVLLGVLLVSLSVLSLGVSIHAGLTLAPYENTGYFIVEALLMPLAVPAFGLVGLLVTWRDPRHWVGWICLGLALIIGIQRTVWQLAVYLSTTTADQRWISWLANLVDPEYIFPPFALLLLLFPTGRLLSSGWRVIAWSVVVITVMGHLVSGFGTEIFIDRNSKVDNPYTFPVLARMADAAEPVFLTLSGALLLASIVSLVLRWRQATGIERQQLKWLAYVGGYLIVTIVALGISAAAVGMESFTVVISVAVVAGISIGIPAATGIAILRYGLFDVDLLINRTLVYSLVMVILAGAYGASVVLLQSMMGFVAGSSSIAVAASTLAAVALFQPLRSRVQTWVDRRFYRTRYNAALALAQFGYSVRDEVDLERLERALCRLLSETMQPQRVAFWSSESDERVNPGKSIQRVE